MPWAPAEDAPAISPSVCISRVNPVGAMPNGSAEGPPKIVHRGVDRRHVAQHRRVELDVLERLPRAGQRQLALGGAVRVVEGGRRGAALGDVAQVGDRERACRRRFFALSVGFLNRIRSRISSGRGNWRLTILIGLGRLAVEMSGSIMRSRLARWREPGSVGRVVVREQAVARSGDVVAGEGGGARGVAGGDGVEDALVLRGDLGRGEQVMGLHLADAELDLAHEQRVHARQPGARGAAHHRAVERDVVVGERLVARVREQRAVGGQRLGRQLAAAGERLDGRGLDDRAGVVEVDDVVAGELGDARGLVRLAPQQPLGRRAARSRASRSGG